MVRLRHVAVLSVCLSPKYSAQEYKERLCLLEDGLRNFSGRMVVVGGLDHVRYKHSGKTYPVDDLET